MTDDENGDDPSELADVANLVGEALGGRPGRGGDPMAEGRHGAVTGDEDQDFSLTDCEIVAQSYDTETGSGTRLYRVDDERFALSRFRRSASQDWVESLATHGELTVEPVELSGEPIQAAATERGADRLSATDIEHVNDTYAAACERAVWSAIESSAPDDGLVIRGELACIEDPSWRDVIRESLGDKLSDAQVDAVLEGLMDARPDVDWAWCQLYAVYVCRLRFDRDG